MKWRSSYLDEIRGTLEPTKTTFRMWKGRRIAEKKPIPRQPNTFTQVYQRAKFRMALASWKTLGIDEKEYWKAEAGKIGLDGHQLYISKYITEMLNPAAEWLFEDGNGTVLTDYSHNGNNGNIKGAQWVKLETEKWALSFNGVNNRVLIPHNDLFNTENGTILVWLKIRRYSSEISSTYQYSGIFMRGRQLWFRINNDVLAFYISAYGAYRGTPPAVTTLDKDKFYFCSARWKYESGATTWETLLNAKLEGTKSYAGVIDFITNFGFIGYSYYIDGVIGFVAFFRKYLNDEEISAFYNLTKPFFS